MQQSQFSTSLYSVRKGEVITVEVEAVQVGNLITFTKDEVPDWPRQSDDPRAYQFKATKDPGFQHRTTLSFFFPDEAPAGALYRVFASGDQGGGRFTGPVVRKQDADNQGLVRCNINFDVE